MQREDSKLDALREAEPLVAALPGQRRPIVRAAVDGERGESELFDRAVELLDQSDLAHQRNGSVWAHLVSRLIAHSVPRLPRRPRGGDALYRPPLVRFTAADDEQIVRRYGRGVADRQRPGCDRPVDGLPDVVDLQRQSSVKEERTVCLQYCDRSLT